MPQPIILTDTDATTSQTTDSFDTRGVGLLPLWTTVIADSDSVNTLVFTRQAGLPFMPCGSLEMSLSQPLLSTTTVWTPPGLSAGGGTPVPLTWTDAFLGVMDETIVVVQPTAQDPGDTEAEVTDGAANVTYRITGPIKGDFGNAFVVDLVDPGVVLSPLFVSSVDGFTMTISLETDGTGVIVTTGSDIELLLTGGGGGPGNVGQNWAIVCDAPNDSGAVVEVETLPLTGGAVMGMTGVTYTVVGNY